MVATNFDIAVVGHFSIDSIKLPSNPNPYQLIGGPVVYVSLTAKRLGRTVAIISNVGTDFPESYLQVLLKEGIDISNIVKTTANQTTRFELKYNEDLSSRLSQIEEQGRPHLLRRFT